MSLQTKNENSKQTSKPAQINVEDLEVRELQRRLDLLLKELDSCKSKCDKYKKENVEYRNGIEALDKDNREYVTYLQSKKSEKLDAIQQLSKIRLLDEEKFIQLTQDLNAKHENEVKSLTAQISDLDRKLLDKQIEFSSLQVIVDKRKKHYAEVAVIKAEIDQSNSEFQKKIAALEDELLKERIVLQIDSKRRIEDVKLHANEKAAQYLAEHCTSIKNENQELEKELAKLIASTTKLSEKKEQLRLSVSELERQRRIKAGVVVARMKKIDKAEQKMLNEKNAKKVERTRKNIELAKLLMSKSESGNQFNQSQCITDTSDDEDY